jgi:hypothetical protein
MSGGKFWDETFRDDLPFFEVTVTGRGTWQAWAAWAILPRQDKLEARPSAAAARSLRLSIHVVRVQVAVDPART